MSLRPYDSEGDDANAAAHLAAILRREDGSMMYWDGLGLDANPYQSGTANALRWSVQWEMAAKGARRDLMTQRDYLHGRSEFRAAVTRVIELFERIQREWSKGPARTVMEIRAVREMMLRCEVRLNALPPSPSADASGHAKGGS